MSKLLFGVCNTHTKKLHNMLFSDKQAAKALRDELNVHKGEVKDKGWRVTYGPDHWRMSDG